MFMLYNKFHCRIVFLKYWTRYTVCIAVLSFPGFDIVNFETNLIFLIQPFFYMTTNSRPKFKFLENEKRSKMK